MNLRYGLRLQGRQHNAFFPLPSVMDAHSFVGFVRSRTSKLTSFCESEVLTTNDFARSSFFDCIAREKVREDLHSLLGLKIRDVERAVWEEQGLCDERLATCIVPYQVAANIILNRLPECLRRKSLKELKDEESQISSGVASGVSNRFIQWVEEDVYVATGIDYLRRLRPRPTSRVPVIAVMGHTQHGKTAFVDKLQMTNIRAEESRGMTQCLRAFTTSPHDAFHRAITLLDTPGERTFVETRLHAQNVADFIALVVSVVDGVRSQTHEVVKVALNLDKPLIVLFNKIDLFSDTRKAAEAVSKVIHDLREAGLYVTLMRNSKGMKEPRAIEPSTGLWTGACVGEGEHLRFFAPMKSIDPTYRGSRSRPCVDLHRSCVGICVSAKDGRNIDLFYSVLELMLSNYSPQCINTGADYASRCCSIQGVVLESSKHLFDEEGFRQKKSIQNIVRRQDLASRRHQHRFERNSISVRINSSINNVRNKISSANPTSSNCLVLTVIVKEGCITRGMPFVADQSKGRVDYMVDSYGNFSDRAPPGTAVTLVDVHNSTGCPGVGTHVLSVPSLCDRDRINSYRRLLQWFVECFPHKLYLLRPRGMDTSFRHLGDYGQLNDTTCLEYQLLYGSPQATLSAGRRDPTEAEGHSPTVPHSHTKSIAEYMYEKNLEDESRESRLLPQGKAVSVGVMSGDSRVLLERTWSSLQLENQPRSQEAYDEFLNGCIQIGLVFKVDSWHSARMLSREAAKLGTRKITFHVVGIRFGELSVDDILFFGRTMKVVVCYRTPVGASAELDQYVEANDTWVLQTDDIRDVTLFLKWCAVALHREHATGDFNDSEETCGSGGVLYVKDILKDGVSDMASYVTEGDTSTKENYLLKAAQLYAASKYLLAVKAYERAFSAPQEELVIAPPYAPLDTCTPVPQEVLFRHFVLYCNTFCVSAASVNDQQAEDFLLAGLMQLEERNFVPKGLLTVAMDDMAKRSIGGSDSGGVMAEDEGTAFLVAATLNNWGCLLLRRKDLDRALYFLQLALSSALSEELARIILLNMCTVYIGKCSFDEARQAAMEVCKGEEDDGQNTTARGSAISIKKDINNFLVACAYFNLGVVGEYSSPAEAEKYYCDAALAIVGSPYQQWTTVFECSSKRFQEIVQQRRNEAAARQTAAMFDLDAVLALDFSSHKKVSTEGRKRAPNRASKGFNSRGKTRSGTSSATGDDKSDLFEPPPISDEVRWVLLNKGLENIIVPLIGLKEAQNCVLGTCEAFDSPFSFVPFTSLRGVVMLSLLEETPLQLADEVERGSLAFAKRSVWSLFTPRYNQGFIIPSSRARPSLVPSPTIAGIMKSVVPLSPLSEKVINDALRNVAGLKKVLNNRLSALVQAENAFEEKWRATHMIREALVSFNFVQDFIKLKESMKSKRLVQRALERLSARRIVRFLRVVIEAKRCREAPTLPLVRAKCFEGNAVIVLQKNARIWLAKRELQRRRAEKQAHIKRIAKFQSLYRGRVARTNFFHYREERRNELLRRAEHERREFAARLIQGAYRRHAFLLSKWRDMGQIKRYVLHHYRYSREHSARVIQKTFRGFLVRRVYGREVRARCCYGRNCYRAAVLGECATKIQAVLRGHLVRKRVRGLLGHHKTKLLAESVKHLERVRYDAVVAIQCAFRRHAAKKRLVGLRAQRDRERLLRRNRVYPDFRLEEQVY